LHHFRVTTARFFRRLIRLIFCCLPAPFLARPPEYEDDLGMEPTSWGPELPYTIQDIQPQSPDEEVLSYSTPTSPSPPYLAIEERIQRISSPTWEPPIASRGLGFNYGMSITSDIAEDYFGSIRGRLPGRLNNTEV
jgi:hypothetical protein